MLWSIFCIAAPLSMGIYCIVTVVKNVKKLFKKKDPE